jgi:hypothetical protein
LAARISIYCSIIGVTRPGASLGGAGWFGSLCSIGGG